MHPELVRPVKFNARSIMKTDDALGRGMDFAFVTLLFLGIGFLVDRWLGTTPLFMIVLVVLALVGQFVRIWYGYEATMREHEAARAQAAVRPERADRTDQADIGVDA